MNLIAPSTVRSDYLVRFNRSAPFLAPVAAVALGLLASSGLATHDETAVAGALDRVVENARSGDAADLAALLGCTSGVEGLGTVRLRPCVLPHDAEWVHAVGETLRELFAGHSYVIDWLVPVEDDGLGASVRLQVKIRSREPPALEELRLRAYGEALLLTDVGTLRLEPPVAPPPATPHEEAARAMRWLLYPGIDAGIDELASHIACFGGPPVEKPRPCDPTKAADAGRVEAVRGRLQAFVRRVGPTGWAFTGYREDSADGAAQRVLEIGYLAPQVPAGRDSAEAVFVETERGWALAELTGWPD